MSKYQLKQKFLSITEKFEIKNAQDQIVYVVDGKFFTIGKQFKLSNNCGEVVAEIKQKVFAFRPTFDLSFQNGESARIIKTFLPIFRSRFVVNLDCQGKRAREITVSGNFMSHEYQFIEHQQVIASVSKQWFSLSDTYGLEVLDETLAEVMLSLIIVIDAIHHGRDND